MSSDRQLELGRPSLPGRSRPLGLAGGRIGRGLIVWMAYCSLLLFRPAAADEETPRAALSAATSPADEGPPEVAAGRPENPRQAVPEPSQGTARGPVVAPLELLPGEAGPPTFLLEDQHHQLQPVLGFSYEDFMRLFQQLRADTIQPGQPRYTIDRLDIAGREASKYAELELQVTITVTVPDWVRLPLRLSRAILLESQYDGPGEFRMQVQDNPPGEANYVGWVRAGAVDPGQSATATLRLKLLAPLSTSGAETRLKLAMPRAAISQLKLTPAAEHTGWRVSEGSVLAETPSGSGALGQVMVSGTGGDTEIAWRAGDAVPEGEDLILEATGVQLVRMDGRSVNTEARLTVRSYGRSFDELQIRLPEGAELVSGSQAGLQLSVVSDTEQRADAPGRKRVKIKLDKPSAGPVEIKLVTERAHRPTDASHGAEPIDLSGFEVVGAARQFGHLAVAVVGNWQIQWGAAEHVSRTDDLPAALRGDDLVAGFEYAANPFTLVAEISPQRTRMRVQPEHIFRVSAGYVELESRLRYSVRGSKVRRLELEMADWEIDEVGPATRVASDGIADRTESTLTIPLAQESSGDFEIKILARRPIASGADTLALDLPRPVVQSSLQALLNVLPANVVIVPEENVELQPRELELKGLVRQPLRADLRLPERSRDPLSYRCEGGAGKFIAGFRVRAQEIRVQMNTLIAVENADVAVEQTLDYRVTNEAASKLRLDVPRAIPLEQLVIQSDGQAGGPVTPRPIDQPAPNGQTRVEVALAEPRLGRVRLTVKFPWRIERSAPISPLPVDVPLVTPVEGDILQNQLLVTAGAGVQVTARPGNWRADDRSRGAALPIGSLALAASGRRSDANLLLQFVERQLTGTTQIEQAWIQTRLTENVRQERAVFRVVSNDRQLRLNLPETLVEPDTMFLLNNKAVKPRHPTASEWIVPLAGSGTPQLYVLEIRYRFRGRPAPGAMALQAPTFPDQLWQRHLYWQVIAPALEHLLWGPAGFSAESSWQWRGIWRRQPALEQDDLEHLLGVSSAAPPVLGANRYLFSTVGSAPTLEIRTVRRTSLVLCASLAVLSSMLALIYWPVSRHPGFLMVAATVLIALSIMNPEASLLVAQAASLGGMLGIVGYILARMTFRRRRAPISRGSSISSDRSPGSQPSQRLARGMAPTTAATPLLQGSSRRQELP